MYSALAVAHRIVQADAVVVVMGPGIVGTASRLGFSGIEVGPVLDAATGLSGTPIACLRVSFADPRDRHRGVSHHSVTALTVATRSRVTVAFAAVGGDEEATMRAQLEQCGIDDSPRRRRVRARRHRRPVRRGTDCASMSMGRPAADDPVLFEMAAAAGRVRGRDASHCPPSMRACRTRPARVERVLNLLALLLDTRVALHARGDRARGRAAIRSKCRRTGVRSSATRKCCAAWACRSRRR